MSCRNEGERVQNQRPALMAVRSSILSMGSSMAVGSALITAKPVFWIIPRGILLVFAQSVCHLGFP